MVTEKNELLDVLEGYLVENCDLKPKYQQHIQSFFPLNDTNNCERIYAEIKKL